MSGFVIMHFVDEAGDQASTFWQQSQLTPLRAAAVSPVVVDRVGGWFPMVARRDMPEQRKSGDHDVQPQFLTVQHRIGKRRLRQVIDRRPSSPRGLSLRIIISELSLRPGGLAAEWWSCTTKSPASGRGTHGGLIPQSRNVGSLPIQIYTRDSACGCVVEWLLCLGWPILATERGWFGSYQRSPSI
jgi:hypothetical protein